ncbi:ATP-dependent translocase ABCB1 [Lamellibrachia satsuma]|nr:ATP-dependent translocase ABCB1 [Lamellibrachia satsuma]
MNETNEEEHSTDITKEDNKLEGRQKSVFVRLVKLNAADWPYLVAGGIAAVIAGCAGPMFAVIYSSMMKEQTNATSDALRTSTYSRVIDRIRIQERMLQNFAITDSGEQMDQARTFSIIVFGVAVLLALIHFIHQLTFEIVGENLTMRLRRVIFKCMLRQEIGWFDQTTNKIGILTSRLAVDATIVRGVSGTQLGNVFLTASSLLVSLLVAFLSSWKLSLVVLLFIPFFVAAGIARGKDVQGSAQRSMRAAEQGGKIASEAISSIRTVAALTIESKFEHTFDEFFIDIKRKQRAEAVKAGLFYGFTQSVTQFCYAAAFLYGSLLVAQGEMEFQDIFK